MRSKLLVAGLVACCLPLSATAVPVYGEFTATVWGVTESGAPAPGGIAAGALVTGAFQFENTGQAPYAVLGDGIDETRYLSYSSGSFLRISIGSSIWEASGLSVGVRNDSANLADDHLGLIYSTNLASAFDPAFPPATSFPGIPPGTANSSFGIALFDTVGPFDLVSSQALPGSASAINTSATTFMNGSIFGSPDGFGNSFYFIGFNLDSVSFSDVRSVPEPGTLALLAAGLLAIGLFARRRTRVEMLRAA